MSKGSLAEKGQGEPEDSSSESSPPWLILETSKTRFVVYLDTCMRQATHASGRGADVLSHG